MTRIKGNTHTRKGSNGYTELVQGENAPKSDQICFINNEIQKAVCRIKIWNLKYNLIEKEDLELLNHLANPELHNLIGSLWCKLKLTDLLPTTTTVNDFRERLSEINKQFPSASEFLVFTTIPSLEFNMIVLDIRNIEHFVWTIVHRWYGYNPDYYPSYAEITGDFYNMLGDYMFNLCRLIEKKVALKEEYWKNPLTQPSGIIESQLSSMG